MRARRRWRSTMSDDDDWALFEEPADFRPPTPPPTNAVHTMTSGAQVHLQLVGSHPLWGHYLWNAAPTLSNYLEAHSACVTGKDVLELGAASGLPSIVCDKLGARRVVSTDYPDPDLMQNLARNLAQNECEAPRSVAQGYIWGADVAPLLAHAPQGFDLILMSDLIFNHQAHPALLDTVDRCLAARPGTQVLVFFSHHRPHLAVRDLAFFPLAEARDYTYTKLGEWVLSVRLFSHHSPCFLRIQAMPKSVRPCMAMSFSVRRHGVRHLLSSQVAP